MPRKERTETKKKEIKVDTVNNQTYSVNDKVLCKHIDNLYYEAKIIGVEQPLPGAEGEIVYTVHYQGWNQRHDEKIPHTLSTERFKDYTPINIERAKTELRDAQARLLQNKKKGKRPLNDDKKGGVDSRGSTPSDKNTPRGPSSSRAPSIISEKASGQGSHSTKRRKGGTEVEHQADASSKNEIKIEIPSILRKILVDDQEMVRQMYLSRVPSRIPVTEIIRQYAEYMANSPEAERSLASESGYSEDKLKTTVATMIESSYGVRDYFNSTLGSQLLYKFERPQYIDLLEAHKKKVRENSQTEDVSEINAKNDSKKVSESSSADVSLLESEKYKPAEQYGYVHLLRLFVRFGSMLSLTSWSDRAVQNILGHVHNFLKFLEVNRNKLFDSEADYVISTPDYQKRVWK